MGHVEPDHRHVEAAVEHPRGGLGIGPDVELGGRRPVALGDRPAHEHDALDPLDHLRVQGQQERDVGERTHRHERDRLGRGGEPLGHEVDGVRGHRPPTRRREVGAVEPRLPVHLARGLPLAHERARGAGGHGHVASPHGLEHAQGVRRRPLQRAVAGHGGHPQELHLGACQREEQGHGVIVAGVAVDEERDGHPGASMRIRDGAMLVTFGQTLTATEVFNLGRFGEVSLSGVGRLRNPTAIALPGAPALAVADQNNRSRIILDDGNNQQNIDPTRYPQGGLSASNTLRVGDTLPGLTGVMDFQFGNYRIQPVGAITWTHSNPRTAAPAAVGGNLKVASFNVLNYFNGNGTGVDGAPGGFPTPRGASDLFEFGRQRAKIISALSAINGDIVGLMEIENDPVPNSAIEDLVAGLNAQMGAGTYAFINTGVIGTDEIKVALIYKPAAVTPVGAFKIITTAVDPRFIDTLNRPSLAQTFQRTSTGARLTVVVNHLKSKGSDCNAVGDPDLGDGAGNCNITRTNAARALVDWLATDPTASGDPDFLIIGDLNSYTFEDPIRHIVSSGYTNLVAQFGGTSAYSYVFNGESGYLDHALASSSLASQATGTTDWHINPDEPTVLDYNVDFKTPNQIITFYDPGPYRASDHDPVIIGLALNAPPTVSAGGPYTVGEGGSVPVTATGFDPDGGALTYAWDLDNNGSFETAGQTVNFSAAGLEAPLSRTIRVRVTDAGGLTAIASATVNVIWNFGGISGGVAERPATNVVKAGSTLAIKFSLGGDQGLGILAAGYPASIEYTCGGALPTDATDADERPRTRVLGVDGPLHIRLEDREVVGQPVPDICPRARRRHALLRGHHVQEVGVADGRRHTPAADPAGLTAPPRPRSARASSEGFERERTEPTGTPGTGRWRRPRWRSASTSWRRSRRRGPGRAESCPTRRTASSRSFVPASAAP